MNGNSEKKTLLIDRIFDFLCSVKLSLFVLLGLAVTSIVGTVVEQNEEAAHYLQHYGPSWGAIINAANFSDMYHAWWFQALLALLMVNIVFCSARRLPAAIRQMRDNDPVYDKREKPVAIHEKEQFAAHGSDAPATMEKIASVLGSRAGRLFKAENDDALYLMASKGGWCRMGVYVTHFSLFLFALGAIVGLMFGFKGVVNVKEGETATQVYDRATKQMVPINFGVRCDDFEVTYYPGNGRVKDYSSKLVVIDGGKEVESKTIEVNDPLIYKGYYFYQSSYGKAAFRGAVVTVAGPDRNILAQNITLNGSTPTRLPDGSEIMIRDLQEDKEDGGPTGLILAVGRGGQLAGTGSAYEPMYGRAWWPLGDYHVRLDKLDWLEYTGLQVARDPGVPIVWAGCIMITFGLMVSFFMSHRRIWVKVVQDEKGLQITVAGNASRNRVSFENHFNGLCEEIKEATGKKQG